MQNKYKHDSGNPSSSLEQFIEDLNQSRQTFSAFAPRIYAHELVESPPMKFILFSDPRRKGRKKTLRGFKETESVNFDSFSPGDLKVFSVYETFCFHLKTTCRKEKRYYSSNVSSPIASLFGANYSYYTQWVHYSRVLIGDTVYVIDISNPALYTLPNA